MKIVVTAKGHPNLRLTHDKTLEWTTDAEITRRATCVIGVEARFDACRLRRLIGGVEARVEADGHVFTCTGQVNPDFVSREKIIFRRSDVCDRHTLLVGCDRLAGDVPTAMRDALAAGAELTLQLTSADPENVSLRRQCAPYENGALYLVARDIGRVEDLAPSAVEVLRAAQIVAAEDTRQAIPLLRSLGITAPRLLAYHEHSKPSVRRALVKDLAAGRDVALLSDAGMPALADPGFKLVREALENDLAVVPIAGTNAALAAVAVSGLPTDAFTFLGFLPRAPGKRRSRLRRLAGRPETLIFYEAPHRILETLSALEESLGDRPACLAREMTKEHEEFLRGPLSSIRQALLARPAILGEITLVVAGDADRQPDLDELRGTILGALEHGEAAKAIRDRLAPEYGLPKREVYRMVLDLKAEFD